MLILVGLILVGDLTSIEVPPVLQYVIYGGFFGAMGGNEVVVRRERRKGEMPPDQVRHIVRVSVSVGVAAGALAVLVQVALAHL
jgi:hypothetical protein